ncbi:MAG: adenylate/guanylate cyclase domain-containing protein [Desulfobacterales bacterium]|nr:adenylate/guanylate cyclase domain-containing protein [Desulfobacterales bacterium]
MYNEHVDELNNLSEDEYGGGNELTSTGFLIFGLLTFWIYTVWLYFNYLEKHFNLRLNYFNSILMHRNKTLEIKPIPDEIIKKGFSTKRLPRLICVIFYSISMLIIVTRVIGIIIGMFVEMNYYLDMVSTGIASLSFCISSIYFMWWVCDTVRKHEYYELLLTEYIKNPDNFKMVPPSRKFIERWNQRFNKIAFFLILCVPITISPLIALKHFYKIIESGGGDMDYVVIIWQIMLYTCATVFHIWGTFLLIDIYNGHLRIENFNRSSFITNEKWVSNIENSVIDSLSGKNKINIGDLVPKRALAAIMITDIVGFSKEMEKDEEYMYNKLLKHNEIIRSIIKNNNGYEIKTIGDAFLVRFESAVDAVKAGMSIQNKFSDYNKNIKPCDRILVRIGIHIGDILMMDGDIIGNGVNITSRIEPLAEPGGICISADVYNIIKKSIDIKVINIGKKELKNIKDVPEIYRILIESTNCS